MSKNTNAGTRESTGALSVMPDGVWLCLREYDKLAREQLKVEQLREAAGKMPDYEFVRLARFILGAEASPVAPADELPD